MERLLEKLSKLIKNEIPFYPNAKYFPLYSQILISQYKKYETQLTKGNHKLLILKKQKQKTKQLKQRIPIYQSLYPKYHKPSQNLWLTLTKLIFKPSTQSKLNELTLKYIKSKAVITIERIIELFKHHKFVFSKETIVKFYLYLNKCELLSKSTSSNVAMLSITSEDHHIIEDMKSQLECFDKFDNKTNIVTQYFLSNINPVTFNKDSFHNEFVNKYHKANMLNSIFASLNKDKLNKKREENKTLQQEPHHHKYIRSISNINFKLNRNSNSDIAKTEEIVVGASEQDRKVIASNLSIKDRIFGSALTSRRNIKVNYCTTHKMSKKKNEGEGSGSGYRSKIVAKKKMLMLHHHKLNSFDRNDNLVVQLPLTCYRSRNNNINDNNSNSNNMISFKRTNFIHKPKIFEFHRQMSMKNYMSKNDFYYS